MKNKFKNKAMEAIKERRIYEVDQVGIDNSLVRCEQCTDGLQGDIEGFKRLQIGNLTDSVFEAIVTGNLTALREVWDEKVKKEVANITTNKEIAQGFISEANAPFEEFETRLRKHREERYSLPIGGQSLDTFFKLVKGKVQVDEVAIKDHFTSYWSDEGLQLLQLAETAQKALEAMVTFIEKQGNNIYKHPVLQGDLPFRSGPFVMQGSDPLIYQREGKIKIDEHEIFQY